MTVMNSVKIVSAAVLMLAVTSLPYTADAGSRFRGESAGTGLYLVDTDGDGIGDTRPEPGTGIGANATEFVDADGDGICDTYAEGGEQLLDGSGAAEAAQSGMRMRGGR